MPKPNPVSCPVPVTMRAKRPRQADAEKPVDAAAHDAEGARLSQQFALQGIEYKKEGKTLYCAMCQAAQKTTTRISLDVSAEAVLFHCSTRAHLVAYEKIHAEELKEWFPVELHGHRMLLDHHCIYPRAMFGPGRLLMDETIAKGMLIAEDVCGGVSLLPLHTYTVTELVLSSSRAFTLPRSDEVDGEKNPTDLARCTMEPFSSLPTHMIQPLFQVSKKLPPELSPIGSYHASTRLPLYTTSMPNEQKYNAHMRLDKLLDAVNADITAELAVRQKRETKVLTTDTSNM